MNQGILVVQSLQYGEPLLPCRSYYFYSQLSASGYQVHFHDLNSKKELNASSYDTVILFYDNFSKIKMASEKQAIQKSLSLIKVHKNINLYFCASYEFKQLSDHFSLSFIADHEAFDFFKIKSFHSTGGHLFEIPWNLRAGSTLSKNKRSVWIKTSYGCTHQCDYCHVQRSFIPRAVDDLQKEISFWKHQGASHFIIEDDLLNCVQSHFLCVLKVLKNSGCSWEALNGLNPSLIQKGDLQLLQQHGCSNVAIGFESLSPEFHVAHRRTYINESFDVICEELRELSLICTGYFLVDALLQANSSLPQNLWKIRNSPIQLLHFSVLNKKSNPLMKFVKWLFYLFVYLEKNRILLLWQLGLFNSKKIYRLINKLKRG